MCVCVHVRVCVLGYGQLQVGGQASPQVSARIQSHPDLLGLISFSPAQPSLFSASPQKGCTEEEGSVHGFLTSWLPVSQIPLFPNYHSLDQRSDYLSVTWSPTAKPGLGQRRVSGPLMGVRGCPASCRVCQHFLRGKASSTVTGYVLSH